MILMGNTFTDVLVIVLMVQVVKRDPVLMHISRTTQKLKTDLDSICSVSSESIY